MKPSSICALLAIALAENCDMISSFSIPTPIRATPSSNYLTRHLPHQRSRSTPVSRAAALTLKSHADKNNKIIGTVALLVPSNDCRSKFGSKSPLPPPSYREVAEQLARKISHFSDGRISTEVVSPPDKSSGTIDNDTQNDACLKSDALIAIGLTTPSDIRYLSETFRLRRSIQQQTASSNTCQFAIDCGDHTYAPIVGPYDEANPSPLATLAPWSDVASGKRLSVQMTELFDKYITDEFALAMMLFFNQFSGHNIPWVQHSIDVTWEKGIYQNAKEIYSMITKCGPCITECLADENCSACIKALDKIDTRNQVESYRTVVSYESTLLRDFSLCILQKNNIFECKATIPKLPVVKPMSQWRGKELTVEGARGIMIGHLEGAREALVGSKQLDVSWKVACGANAAYDQFPSQNQLFYPNAKGKDLWYDPVFRVETIDGRNVWCKRHYKVRNGEVPGTFRFSVLDNGVTSDEFWTIVGAADDLSWVVFHYAGAAGAVGQRYIGGLLCTPDGQLPPSQDMDEIWKVFRSAEIEPWELFVVDNDMTSQGSLAAGPPPLDYYRKTAAVIA